MNGSSHSIENQKPPAPGPVPYAQAPPAPATQSYSDPRSKSPALACVLSVMPGLGQVYVGYYPRGFAHALTVAGIIAVLSISDGGPPLLPLGIIFLIFFWLYNIIDAGRRATLYNQALAGTGAIELPEDFRMPSLGGSIVGGLALIVGGAILLSNTAFDLSLAWLEDWWPVAPILFGVYLLGRAIQERRPAAESTSEGRTPDPSG